MLTGDSADHESSVSAAAEDLTHSDGRRRKALLVLMACLGAGAAPHCLGPLRGLIPAVVAALLLGAYSISTLRSGGTPLRTEQEKDSESVPAVDVLVAARDEEAVIRDAKMDWREEYVTDSKGLERIVTWRGF